MACEYLVIDINYFPGFEKLPNYEEAMVKFLVKITQQQQKQAQQQPGEVRAICEGMC